MNRKKILDYIPHKYLINTYFGENFKDENKNVVVHGYCFILGKLAVAYISYSNHFDIPEIPNRGL